MSEEALKQQKAAEVAPETGKPQVQKQDVETAISKLADLGGFNLIKGMLPEAEKLDPRSKAGRNIFLTDAINKDKRKRLAKDIEKWLKLLEEDKTAKDLADECKQNEEKAKKLFADNIYVAVDAIKNLESSYRTLDAFYKNANTDKASQLRVLNVSKSELRDSNSEYVKAVNELLKNAYDRLSLKDSYSLVAVPGYICDDKSTLLMWAKMAHKYKVLLVSDHYDDTDFDSMVENVEKYKDSDIDLQNVMMCCNWILGREKETLADEEEGLYIPPSGALTGMLYNEDLNIAQGAAGKKYGTLQEVKGVRLDLLKAELASLADQQVIPFTFSEGRVMAFNNASLFNGDNKAMTEYPIVRVFEWVKKVLVNFLNDEVLQNWDTKVSPRELKSKISDFLNAHKGYGKLFEDYSFKSDPRQDPETKNVTLDIDIKPYFAAKNFIIKLSADKNNKDCKIE